MGLFSKNVSTGINNIEVGVQECNTTFFHEAALQSVLENEQNYNAIMEEVGIAEYNYFENHGEEMVYEAGNISGFISKVKEFFKKALEKIKGLFLKFFALLDSYTKSDADFISKYRKQLASVNTKDFEYNGFKFDHLTENIVDKVYTAASKTNDPKMDDVASIKTATDATLNEELAKYKELSDVEDEIRGATVGDSSLSANEFSKELFQYFRSGEASKEKIDSVNIVDLLGIISGTNDRKKTAKKNYTDFEKTVNQVIRNLDKASAALIKKVPGKTDDEKEMAESNSLRIQLLNKEITFAKSVLNIAQIANGAQLTAIKDENRQAKSVCVSLLTYKPKNESVDFGIEESGFLSNVVLK